MKLPMIQVRLNDLLKSRKMSLYRLAKDSGVPYNTLLRWRDDRLASLDKDVLNRLCNTLDCQLSDLVVHTSD